MKCNETVQEFLPSPKDPFRSKITRDNKGFEISVDFEGFLPIYVPNDKCELFTGSSKIEFSNKLYLPVLKIETTILR